MKRKSFRLKIIIPTISIMCALLIGLTASLSIRFSALSDSLIDNKLLAITNSLKSYLNDNRDRAAVAVTAMSYYPSTVKAVKERDREQLLNIFTPMQDLFGVNFFTICDDKGVVLARTHEPENFGDSIANQQNIKNALNGIVSTWFEEGTVVKVSVRAGAPVYDENGVLIGVISAGTRFDTDSTVEELKRIFKSEVTVFLGDKRVTTTIARDGEKIIGTVIQPEIADIVIKNGQEYSNDVDMLGERYKAFYLPLFNSENIVFASFVLDIPKKDVMDMINQSLRNSIIIGVLGLAISIILSYFILSSISRPITKIADDMNLIANGELDIKINVSGEDEIGYLGKSLQKLTFVIRKLIKDINEMIAEQAKGNTDFYFDTTNFSGYYEILAENILRVMSVNITDQLTGLHNKHSFDNRLEWEWNRSKKEKTPISILLLEIDSFDDYIKSYGEDQGNAALKTVAQIIKRNKRQDDFAARWSESRIVILMTSANSNTALDEALKIRKLIESAEIPTVDEKGSKITVCIGVSTKVPDDSSKTSEIISLADVSLFKAKEKDPNKIVMFQLEFMQ